MSSDHITHKACKGYKGELYRRTNPKLKKLRKIAAFLTGKLIMPVRTEAPAIVWSRAKHGEDSRLQALVVDVLHYDPMASMGWNLDRVQTSNTHPVLSLPPCSDQGVYWSTPEHVKVIFSSKSVHVRVERQNQYGVYKRTRHPIPDFPIWGTLLGYVHTSDDLHENPWQRIQEWPSDFCRGFAVLYTADLHTD